jgi:hypothetical protein
MRIIAKGVFIVTSLMQVYSQFFAMKNELTLNAQTSANDVHILNNNGNKRMKWT